MKRYLVLVLAGALLALAATPLGAGSPPPPLKTTEFGKGPVIVLLPGLGSPRMQWMPTARRLLANYRVVMADLPGHGESAMPDPFSLEAAADMLDALLAKQPAESTIVVAHGVGGMIGVLEARRHPERMKGLVVVDGSLKLPMAIPDQQKQGFMEYVEANYDAFLRMMFKPLGRDSVQSTEIYAKAALVPSQNVKAYMRQLLYADATGAAKAAKVPMLYVGSSKAWPDTISWAWVARKTGWEGVPCETRRIANSGYLMMADQPDTLAQALSAFAQRVIAKKDVASSE